MNFFLKFKKKDLQMNRITIEPIYHQNEHRIRLSFDDNQQILSILKRNFPSLKLSKSLNCFHIAADRSYRSKLFTCFKGVAWLDFKTTTPSRNERKENPSSNLAALSEENHLHIAAFKNYLRSKRYSESTVKTYSESIVIFLRYFADKELEEIDNDDLITFNNDYILKNNLSSSYQNQVVNGVKLFFRAISGYKMDVDLIHRPRREKLLPNVLSKEEVKKILNAPFNLKHRAMLALIYSCGLRRSELLNLTKHDIDSNRNVVIIRMGKGKKDRIVPLSAKILELLRDYYSCFHPKTYLFEGQAGGKYSPKSLENVLKQSLLKAQIDKPVTLHWLRHSYATHLLENGTDLRFIQELLGHKSSRTTEIYTHVSTKHIQNIRSPFDDL